MSGPTTLVEAAVGRALRRRPGVVVGLVDGDDRWVGAGGDLEEDSVVEIGSVTKVFTATLLADMVVRGEVRLDTPVRDLLPEGATVPGRDGVEITLEHLATHRSGLPRSPVGVGVVSGTVEMLRGRNPYAGFGREDLLRGLADTEVKRVPGTGRQHYSNAGFGLLGIALSLRAGTTYDALVAERVCVPLGLDDTVTPATATEGQRARWARGHRRGGRSADDWVLEGIAGAGALRSTAADLLDFLVAQIDPASGPISGAVHLAQERTLGWQRLDDQGRTLLWHNGGTGGFRSTVAVQPERGRAVVVLTDCTRGVDLVGMRLLRDLGRSG